jgi:hypothetical protein
VAVLVVLVGHLHAHFLVVAQHQVKEMLVEILQVQLHVALVVVALVVRELLQIQLETDKMAVVETHPPCQEHWLVEAVAVTALMIQAQAVRVVQAVVAMGQGQIICPLLVV